MGHAHHHHHHGRPNAGNKRRLAITLVLAGTYMVAEAVGGFWTQSLALLADAGHMLADVAALALSFVAVWITERPASSRRTFGYHRAEILAALVNGATLIGIALFIFAEAIQRFQEPRQVLALPMLTIATGGLAINLISLFVLSGGKHENLNIRGAWLHVAFDALGSIGAITTGALIWKFGWNWLDPVASLLIGSLVIYSAWALVTESVAVLMESVPPGIDIDEVRQAIGQIPGVIGVHDLHVWSITSGFDAMSAHVVSDHARPDRDLLKEIRQLVHDRFSIEQITIQIEPEEFEEFRREHA